MEGNLRSREKILIADDERDFAKLLAFDLVKRGYDVVTASDGEEVLIKAKAEQPALILFDIKMPKMDGYSLVRSLRKDPDLAGIPLIVLSGFDMKDMFEMEGISGYFIKSDHMTSLFDTISQTLSDKTAKQGTVP